MVVGKLLCFPVGKGRIYADLMVLALFGATVATLVAQFSR